MFDTLSGAQKAVVSLVFLVGAIAAVFVPSYDLNFTESVVALVGPVFALIGVFSAKVFSPETFEKSLQQLMGAGLAVVGYFTTVPASTEMDLAVLVGAIVSVFAVAKTKNSDYVYGVEQAAATGADDAFVLSQPDDVDQKDLF